MRIGLFAGSAGSNSGGPERYETELVRTLAAIDKVNEYEIFCLFGGGPTTIGVTQDNFRYHTLWPRYRPISMLTSLPVALLRHRLDVLHATFVPPPISPHRYAFTLVCSSMFEYPEAYPPAIRLRLRGLMGLAVRRAELIICVSRHIEDVIRERFAIAPERTAVVYLAASRQFRPIPEPECRAFLQRRYGIDGQYFLFSGRWEPRKNLVRILQAFDRFRRDTRLPHKLVLTGKQTWAARDVEDAIHKYHLADAIIDLGKSPVDELPYLYAGAAALVYPSLWEGFGLPLVEAMSAGTPVITANNTSMAEIGGDAALLVDPLSVEQIAAAMHRIATDPTLCGLLRDRGLQRAAAFGWETTARQTLAAYQRLGNLRR
jgi:glycosyltransferase involved in cell wall biosynthesis